MRRKIGKEEKTELGRSKEWGEMRAGRLDWLRGVQPTVLVVYLYFTITALFPIIHRYSFSFIFLFFLVINLNVLKIYYYLIKYLYL